MALNQPPKNYVVESHKAQFSALYYIYYTFHPSVISSEVMALTFIFTQMIHNYISLLSQRMKENWEHWLQIETCVKEIDLWMVKNKLKLNGNKTELLVVNARNRLGPAIEHIEVSNSRIIPSTSARNIGVTLDQHMSMEKHITNICKNCFFHPCSLSMSDIQTLVHAFITSKLDNCNSLLYGLPKFLIERLQNVQNCAARLVTGSKKYDHITPLMKQLHWLPINQRIIYKIILITYKSLTGSAPDYINNMLKPYTPSANLRSSSKGLLTIPSVKLVNYGERSFSYAAPKLWNELPEYIRKSEDLSILKTRLKTYLFKQYYD